MNTNILAIATLAVLCVNSLLAVWQVIVIVKFERLLAAASQGAADHFEKLRKVRQMGV